MARPPAARARRPVVEPRAVPPGHPPGVLRPSAPSFRAVVRTFHYNAETIDSADGLSAADARALSLRPGVTWVNVDGVADVETVSAFGTAFGLHPLLVEDLVHSHQRPKLEVYHGSEGPLVFVVARMISATALDPALAYCDGDPETLGHTLEQVSFVLGPGWVLSFQETTTGDVFDAVRERLLTGSGRVRQAGADYLLYALLDLVVDHVFETLERIGDATETLEDRALADPDPEVHAAISGLRREAVLLRRAVWPLREVLAGLQREDTPYVEDSTQPYLRDAYDHLVQAVEMLESVREVLGSVSDLYLSALGMRQNEVMKVLTVVGTIFLPLGFLTGLYGMNFDVMPELHWRYGYPALLSVMALVTAGTLVYFRRRGWI